MSNEPQLYLGRKDLQSLWTSMMERLFPDEDLQMQMHLQKQEEVRITAEKLPEEYKVSPANFIIAKSDLLLLKSENSSLKAEVSALKFENQQLKQKILNSQFTSQNLKETFRDKIEFY